MWRAQCLFGAGLGVEPLSKFHFRSLETGGNLGHQCGARKGIKLGGTLTPKVCIRLVFSWRSVTWLNIFSSGLLRAARPAQGSGLRVLGFRV